MRKTLRHPVQSPRWYGSKEVALILNTEEWRIRNFGSKLYGLEAQIKSPGSGNRKRYFFDVVLKLAVADELYSAQMSPVGIRAALDLIKAERLIEKWVASYGEDAPTMVLSLSEKPAKSELKGKPRFEKVWKVCGQEQAIADGEGFLRRGSIAVALDLSVLWERVAEGIRRLEEGKTI